MHVEGCTGHLDEAVFLVVIQRLAVPVDHVAIRVVPVVLLFADVTACGWAAE
jgi:hypothetical protein